MSDTLVVVETYAYDWQAQMAKQLLDGAGVHASIADENVFRVVPPAGDTRQVKLQVWERDLPEAKRILRDRPTVEETDPTLLEEH